MVEAGGGVVDVEVELGQAALHEPPRRSHGIEPALGGLEGHEPPVGLLGVAVEADDRFQDVDRRVGSAGVLFKLCQAEVGVDGTAMQVLSGGFDPGVVEPGEQVAAVGVDRSCQRRSGLVVVLGIGRFAERSLEVPEVAGDLGRVGPVVLASLLQHLEVGAIGAAEEGAQVAEGMPELLEQAIGGRVGPQGVDELVDSGALRT